MQKKQLDFEKELMIKLNERELEVKEECKKKLEDRIKKVTYNLQHEMSLKERDHQFQLERKTVELASVEESLSRAIARKNVAEKKLRLADRDSCKAQISKVTEDETNKIEVLAKKILRSRKFNVDCGRCVKQSKIT